MRDDLKETILPDAARAALVQGNKIEAVKIVREHYGLGLKDALDVVEHYDPEHQGNTSNALPSNPADIPAEAMMALMRGDKIEAIRIVRQQTGRDLKDSKLAVEAYIASNPTLAAQFQSRARSLLLWLVILVAAAVLAYRVLSN